MCTAATNWYRNELRHRDSHPQKTRKQKRGGGRNGRPALKPAPPLPRRRRRRRQAGRQQRRRRRRIDSGWWRYRTAVGQVSRGSRALSAAAQTLSHLVLQVCLFDSCERPARRNARRMWRVSTGNGSPSVPKGLRSQKKKYTGLFLRYRTPK